MKDEDSSYDSYLVDPENPNVQVPAYPAPWKLNGRGCIILYKLDKEFFWKRGFLPKDCEIEPAGGIGALMVVDYLSSDAGPYSELLFMPGKVCVKGAKWDRITKIYVSSMESVLNGRNNWSIPKELATFHFSQKKNIISAEVSNSAKTFFKGSISIWGPKFPISTKFLPFSLLQGEKGSYLNTRFSGSGMGRFALLSSLKVDQTFFPDLSGILPLAAVYVDPFNVVFPKAKLVNR